MDVLSAIFGKADHATLGQECARAVLIFAYGFIAVRLVGRRVFGKWAALDIIVSIVIGSNLSRALTGNAPLLGTLAATSLLLALHWALAQAAARSRSLSQLVEGRPVTLVADGKPDPSAMRRWSISGADLEEALRRHDVGAVEEVREGVLEPSGAINLLR